MVPEGANRCNRSKSPPFDLGKMQKNCTTFEQLGWKSILKQYITVDQGKKISEWVDAKEIGMALLL